MPPRRPWTGQAWRAGAWLLAGAVLLGLGGPVAPLLGCVGLAVALGYGVQAWRGWRA